MYYRDQGYNLLTQYYIKYDSSNQENYIFNYTFGYAFKKIIASQYKLRIVLPPGATNINIYLPFRTEVKEESFRSYLDIEGRRVIVIDKDNMHSYYAKNFLVISYMTVYRFHIDFLLGRCMRRL